MYTLKDSGEFEVGCVAIDIKIISISPPITDVSIIAHKYPWEILSTKNIPHNPKQTQRMPMNKKINSKKTVNLPTKQTYNK